VLTPPGARVLTHSQPGEQVLIIDAGGGTIDISTYKVLSNGPLQVEELYEPKCEPDQPHWQIFLLDILHFRLTPRRGVRYGEGESDGQRCTLTFRPEMEYST
jgi:hypothetical protein